MPANPFCWDMLLLETRGDRYMARRAVLSIATRIVPAAECPAERNSAHTAPLSPVSSADLPEVEWLGEFSMSRSELLSTIRRNCEAAAFMQFARAPFAAQPEAQAQIVMGDLRFDRGRGHGSFDIRLDGEISCPRAAPWAAPRADLIGH
jgi:inner membrane protein